MSKEAILGAIRRGLKRGPLPGDQAAMLRQRMAHPPRHLVPARSQVPRPDQVALLVRNIEKEFGTVARVPSGDEVPEAVAGYLAGQNLPSSIVMAPHPELRALPWSARPLLLIREGRAEGTDLVSLQHGFAGIAETGARPRSTCSPTPPSWCCAQAGWWGRTRTPGTCCGASGRTP